MEFQKIPMDECGIYMIASPSGKSYIGRLLSEEHKRKITIYCSK